MRLRDKVNARPQRTEIPHSGSFWIEETSKSWNKQSRMARIGAWPTRPATSDVRFRLFRGSEEAPPSRGMVFVGATPSVKGRGRDG